MHASSYATHVRCTGKEGGAARGRVLSFLHKLAEQLGPQRSVVMGTQLLDRCVIHFQVEETVDVRWVAQVNWCTHGSCQLGSSSTSLKAST